MAPSKSKTGFRRALITGAAGGLGSLLARRLAMGGTNLVLLDVQDEPLARLAKELSGAITVETRACDLREADGFEKTLTALCERVGPIDLAIMNAGIDRPLRMDQLDWRAARDHFSVNTIANLVLLSVLVPRMVTAGGGHFTAVASLAALAGFPYEGPYCASKAALAALVESARTELAPKKVTFTTVYPGFIRTDMLRGNAFKVRASLSADEAANKIYEATVAKRPVVFFPGGAHLSVRIFNALPSGLRDRVARTLMKRVEKG